MIRLTRPCGGRAPGSDQEWVGQLMKLKRDRVVRAVWISAVCLFVLGGCAITPVQPWERGVLAKEEMSWSPNRLETTLNGHIYFSKEASFGGGAAAGGGCGCN